MLEYKRGYKIYFTIYFKHIIEASNHIYNAIFYNYIQKTILLYLETYAGSGRTRWSPSTADTRGPGACPTPRAPARDLAPSRSPPLVQPELVIIKILL